MAKFYVLTKDQIDSGKRPKTPRQKMQNWRLACIVLTLMIVTENIALLVWLKR